MTVEERLQDERLQEAIDLYWQAAYLQGKEGRDHDDEDGTAQHAEDLLQAHIRLLQAKARSEKAHSRLWMSIAATSTFFLICQLLGRLA